MTHDPDGQDGTQDGREAAAASETRDVPGVTVARDEAFFDVFAAVVALAPTGERTPHVAARIAAALATRIRALGRVAVEPLIRASRHGDERVRICAFRTPSRHERRTGGGPAAGSNRRGGTARGAVRDPEALGRRGGTRLGAA
jgi:hypothetical protein